MKSHDLTSLLLLLLLTYWDQADAHCSLTKQTSAKCRELEDARYIDTYNLHHLRAPSSSKFLTPGNFRNLTSLHHLDLSGGKLETIESGSFVKLKSLQTLNLADNHIRHLEAGAFDGLKVLHSLKLGNNSIERLPSALLSLKELRFLDVSENPLICTCTTLKLRDALVARGVEISKKTYCREQFGARYTSILKRDKNMVCLLELQDRQMQGDQPVEGSGEAEEDEALNEAEEDLGEEEKVIEDDEAETELPVTSTEATQASSTTEPVSSEVSSTEAASSITAAKDDISFAESENSTIKEATTETSVVKPEENPEEDEKEEEEEKEKGIMDDLVFPVIVPKETTVNDLIEASSSPKPTDELIVPDEGSGEGDDDGSGLEGSGLIAHMPPIDFNETSGGLDEEAHVSSTSSTTTTTQASWWSIINDINPWGYSAETTTAAPTSTTEKSPEEAAKAEDFIPLAPVTPVVEVIAPKSIVPDTNSKHSPRTLAEPINDEVAGYDSDNSAPSQESKKGMGSYVVLAILLAILALLISFAAYKGDFCRKKPKRRDVERGTELKDMQKSLLEQNSQPKIQVSNGNTMENVPLMNSTLPEEPKDNQRSYDITSTPMTNGANKTNGSAIDPNDPVKPPRRSPNPGDQIEAPLNGLNPPMEDIDATPMHNGSLEYLNNGHFDEQPPLSPNAQRVKITLQENPDSVPKTPILITRLNGGENLVKAP